MIGPQKINYTKLPYLSSNIPGPHPPGGPAQRYLTFSAPPRVKHTANLRLESGKNTQNEF